MANSHRAEPVKGTALVLMGSITLWRKYTLLRLRDGDRNLLLAIILVSVQVPFSVSISRNANEPLISSFIEKKLEDISPFCGATGNPILDLDSMWRDGLLPTKLLWLI